MRQPSSLLLLTLAVLAAEPGHAESSDPSDFFLNGYLSFQKGEKAEAAGNARAALSAYKQAVATLNQISDRWPEWNPPLVKYRRDRASEALKRIQPIAGKSAPGKTDEEAVAGPLPDGGLSLLPDDTTTLAEPAPAPQRGSGGSSGDPIQEIQRRIETLQTDLKSTKDKLTRETEERRDLAGKYAQALKEAEEAVKKQKVITDRADRAEEALMGAEREGATSSEASKKARAELAAARKELQQARIEREAAEEVRQQTADRLKSANARLAATAQERDVATKASADVPGKIAAMQKQLDSVLNEKADLNTRLGKVEQQLATVTAERDGALAQIGKMKEAQKQVDKLITDNTALMAKLSEAEKTISNFKVEGVKKEEEIAGLKKEVTSVRKQLAEAQKESAGYQIKMGDLQTKLEAQSKELTLAKTDASTSVAERKKLQDENGVLRGIVVRQMKEQARRDQTRKLVLGELGRLEIKSKALIGQIEYLSEPVVKLTAKERKLFKQPQIEISEAEISIAAPKEEPTVATTTAGDETVALTPNEKPVEEATPTAPEQSTAEATPMPVTQTEVPEPTPAVPVPPPVSDVASSTPLRTTPPIELASATPPAPLPEPTKRNPAESDLPTKDSAEISSGTTAVDNQPSGAPSVSTSVSPNVPPDLLPLAREGKEQFERGNYRDAEKTYEKILAKAPNNLYALSNLGVARFRGGKLKLAEKAFEKAIAVAPEDAFSHCTLGIVYYSQGKYDEAVDALTKALAISPKNATAHNYLGITASQKGWQEAAQKELETATALDPNYADAFFNLAVVYATQQPPNKESARKHYQRATELGAEPDTALEQLIK